MKIILFLLVSTAFCSFAQEDQSLVFYTKYLEKRHIQRHVDSHKKVFMNGSDTVIVQALVLENRDTVYFAEKLVDSLSPGTYFNALKIYSSRLTIPLITGIEGTLIERKLQDLFSEHLEAYAAIAPVDQDLLKKWYPKSKSWDPQSGELFHHDFWDVLYLDSSFVTVVNERTSNFFKYAWKDSVWDLDKHGAPYFFNPNLNFYHYDLKTLRQFNLIKELTVKGGNRKLKKYIKNKFKKSIKATEKEYDVRIRFKIVSLDYAIVDDELEAHIFIDKHDNYDKLFVKERNYYVMDFNSDQYPEVLPFFKEKYWDLVTDGSWREVNVIDLP